MKSAWKSVLRREISAARRLVVLGVGAPDNGDDAAGVLCAEILRRGLQVRRGRIGERVKVFVSADVPESATGPIRRFQPSLVLIVDSALSNKKPGTVFFIERKELAEEALTTHTIPLRFLSDYIEKTIGCRVLLLGIQPKTLDWGSALSAPVRAAARGVAKEILAGLRESPNGLPVRSS